MIALHMTGKPKDARDQLTNPFKKNFEAPLSDDSDNGGVLSVARRVELAVADGKNRAMPTNLDEVRFAGASSGSCRFALQKF